MKLNLESPVPLYHQLQEILRLKIANRAWNVGTQIPSEHDLCRTYGVTRPTVRQALEGLVREGLLVKRRGKGAFVTDPPLPVGLFSVTGVSDAFAGSNIQVETRVSYAGRSSACILAEGDDPEQGWVKFERVRSLNQVPTFFEYTWISAALVSGLDKSDLNNRSLYKTLQDNFNLRVGGGKQRFSAVAAPLKIARALRVRPGAPLLRVVRSIDLSRGGVATEAFPSAMRIDLYAAQGPFVLEQNITATNAYGSGADHPAVPTPQSEKSAASSVSNSANGANPALISHVPTTGVNF